MQVPQSVREALTQRERTAAQVLATAAQHQEEQHDYMFSLELPDLQDSDTQRMWVKKIVAAENKVIWMPNVMESAGGGDVKGAEAQLTWEDIRKEGYIRSIQGDAGPDMFVNGEYLHWKPAEEGYQLILPVGGKLDSSPAQLECLAETAEMNFKEKRKWFLTTMGKMRTKWEEGHQKIKVRRSNLLEDAHRT
jgi:hypothetical protein